MAIQTSQKYASNKSIAVMSKRESNKSINPMTKESLEKNGVVGQMELNVQYLDSSQDNIHSDRLNLESNITLLDN